MNPLFNSDIVKLLLRTNGVETEGLILLFLQLLVDGLCWCGARSLV